MFRYIAGNTLKSELACANNQINVAKATIEGLRSLRDPFTVAKQRGITIEELFS